MDRFKANREFLKTDFTPMKNHKADRALGISQPPLVKDYDKTSTIIDLPEVRKDTLTNNDIFQCIKERRSVRLYENHPLSLEELSYLLWATQGITKVSNNNTFTLRTVPCSGATHSFETYLFIINVEGLTQGIYRYLPMEHKLLFVYEIENIMDTINDLTLEQPFVPRFASKASVVFAWSTIPYRSEWKFDVTAHKKILIDVGHICQNLYLASESIDAGTCAIGIYDQTMVDNILKLDGENEFTIYLAAVGKKTNK
ncbi:SagB/ThcOx family dehydrogenase [Clostridium sp.]|uniref:SagB/ThcOx family dehydrogenase n=1 Tax=Clostridium sp. TaxID=1506 RepID=UPI002FCB8AFE